MNTKFTKGPWKTGAEYGQIWNVYGADGTPVALASATSADLQQVERTANAALIASALELYEALDSLLSEVRRHSARVGSAWDIEQAINALKKARGEA